jgi:phosphoadenosine phosphosulfate reductase
MALLTGSQMAPVTGNSVTLSVCQQQSGLGGESWMCTVALVEETLFGTRDKVQIAIERLRQFEPAEGYYLAFSGGKDSVCLLRLAEMAGVRFDAHFSLTSVDPPEVVHFVRERYPQVQCHKPSKSMFQLILEQRWPPLRQARYCCAKLKETGGSGRFLLTGIRWAESARRRTRKMVEVCFRDRSKRFLHPIIDWETVDVWQFIREEQVPYCSLYDEGFDRIGCILCPMSGDAQRDIARWPLFARAYIRTFDRLCHLRQALNLKTSVNCSTGQELFNWWILRHAKSVSDEQAHLFD